ncbi:MAG: rRNA maturation RNase YbeY [Candidatus Omnitrophica bacterium]|nr:rRNA maturation RNase YbeY [Candidatus Omnitrophota bacterium]
MPVAWLSRVARCAARRLRVALRGELVVTFIDDRTMRRLNWRFLRHRGVTDVLTFRYSREPLAGEILIAPAVAKRYARRHGLGYREELARYVVHGLLHWTGREDQTTAQRRRMRALEDRLLASCQGA